MFARVVLSPPKVSPAVRQLHPEALSIFKDAYNLEFLGLAQVHAEADRLDTNLNGVAVLVEIAPTMEIVLIYYRPPE